MANLDSTSKILSLRDIDEALFYLKKELMGRKVPYWTMRNGKQIPLADMTTDHLSNTIHMLERMKEEQDIISQGCDNDW